MFGSLPRVDEINACLLVFQELVERDETNACLVVFQELNGCSKPLAWPQFMPHAGLFASDVNLIYYERKSPFVTTFHSKNILFYKFFFNNLLSLQHVVTYPLLLIVHEGFLKNYRIAGSVGSFFVSYKTCYTY